MMQRKNTETYILLRENPDQGVEILYERYGKKLYNYGITSWKLDEDAAWERVYETLYKVTEKISAYAFENEKKFGSFVFTVYCNFLRRNYRDEKRAEEDLKFHNFSESLLDNARFDPSLGAERKVMRQIRDEAVRSHHGGDETENPAMRALEEALDELEDWQRILLLQRSLDRPYHEIAEYVGKPVEQLKVYYQRAKAKLESLLVQKMNANREKMNG